MILFLLFVSLAFFLAAMLRRAGLEWMDTAVATLVWLWADTVLTANLLSPFGLLGHPFAYALVTLASGAVFGAAIRRFGRLDPVGDAEGLFAPSPVSSPYPRADRLLFLVSLVLLVLGLFWHLLVALAIEPWNPDTIMYRLPRVWWYLAQGNLRHFAESIDPRVIFYPFNVSLAYLPFALYRAAPVVFNLPSVAAWATAAAVIFKLARWIGASLGVSGFVAFLIAFAPIVFVEATSTNDEIIAAAAVVSGIYFFLCYFRGGSRLDVATAALALGCGFGAKLHFFFFWPAVITLGIWLGFAVLRNPGLRRFVIDRRRMRDVAAALAVAFLFSAPFLIYNRISSPHFAYTGDTARNSPFSTAVAGQTIAILTGQLFLSPFPTFDTSAKARDREARIEAWNAWWNARLFRNVDLSERAMLATYRFPGVTDPMGGRHFENTEWIGLFPWLLVICGVGLVWCRTPYRWLAVSLAAGMLAWWLSFCATMKYFDTVGVYTAYPLIVCGVFVAVMLMPGRPRFLSALTWGSAAVVAVAHMALCRNILYFNPHAGYPRVMAALRAGKPLDSSAPRYGLGPVLAGLPSATILLTHWAVPYYEVMKTAPGTPYFITNPGMPVRGPVLTLVQANSVFDGYMPVKVSLPQDQGLIYLDTIACYGPEFVFGDAASFQARSPGSHSRYLVFKAAIDGAESSSRKLDVSPQILGSAGLENALKYRLSLLIPGKPAAETGWRSDVAVDFLIGDAPPEGLELRFEIADRAGTTLGGAAFHPFIPRNQKKYNTVNP